jgi:hypothetical protein
VRRLALSAEQQLEFIRGGEGLTPEEIKAFTSDQFRSGSLAGGLGAGLGSLGLSEPPLTPQEAAGPLNTLALGLFPPATGVLQPLLASMPAIRAATQAATLGRRAPTITRPPPAAGVARDISRFPEAFGRAAQTTAVEAAPAVAHAPTVSAQVSRLANFQQPALVRGLEQSRVGRQALTGAQEETLQRFLQDFGISPFEKTGIAGVDTEPLLGRFVTNPKTGVREFVVGAYENPISEQRFFVTFDTNAKTFDIRVNPGEPTIGLPGVPATGGASIQEVEDSLEVFNRFYGSEAQARAGGARGPVGRQDAHEAEQELLGRFEPSERFESIQPDPFGVEGTAEIGRLELQSAGAAEVGQFVKPARPKPSDIPNGPRTADPSGPTPVRPQAAAGVVAEEPEDILARIQHLRTPEEVLPGEWVSRAVEAGRRALRRGDPERLSAIEAREVLRGQTETLLRLHGGALRQAENEIALAARAGSAKLSDLGIGKTVRDRLAPLEKDIPVLDELTNALHNPSKVATGEVKIPAGFEDIYNDLRRGTNFEEAMRIDFDPNMAIVEDYFYRGWKAPEGVARNEAERGRLGTRPGFKKPRVDASYQEMRDAGFEPLFWNPYEQLAHSARMGMRYRQQIQLIDDFKRLGIAVPDSAGTGLQGWRTPKVGPAFEGKPYTITLEDGSQQVAFTKRYVVPEAMAARMENMYGVLPKLKINVGGLEIDLLKVTGVAAFIPKRVKLFASVFQQQDFLSRSLGGAFTGAVDAIRAGQPVEAAKSLARWPKSARTMIQANLGPGARQRIRETLSSTTPILNNRPGVHFKGIMQAGLSNIDPLLGVAELGPVARLAAGDVGKLDIRRVGRLIADWEAAMRRGLFQGLYPAAQITDITNNIAPMLARKWPNLSDEALNGLIARTANIKYSTIPAEQSVFQQRWLRATLARVFFSPGEGEGLLRQGTQAISGPNAAFWRKHWLGAYAGLISVANIIHFASTREALPMARYVPITRDGWGPLPLGYNRDFAAPDIPFTGRSATELTLDIVGQMDTAFRILDPVSFLTSRESVPAGAAETQITGEDFFGRPIDNLGPWGIYSRTAQLAQDTLLPIGVGVSVAQFARNVIPGADEVIGESEGRIGTSGQVIQATGLNVRGETTSMLLDRSAAESGLNNFTTGEPAQKWAELSPRQKDAVMIANPDLERELELRQETAVLRGSKQAQGFQKLDQAGVDRINAEEALVQDLAQGKVIGGLNGFRATYGQIQSDAAVMRSQIDEDFDLFKKDQELPKDPNQRALVQYYAVFDEATRESTQLDFDMLDEELAELEAKWTPAQSAYVDSETGRTEHPPVIQDYLRDRDSENVKDYRFGEREAAKDAGILDQYKEWKRAIDPQGFLEDHPDLDLIVDLQRNVIKPIMRETDLALDTKLWKWGFVDVPVHPDLIVAVDELAIRQGGRVTNPREIDALLPQAAAVAP